ncbi:MAG: DUF4142 domain-containing protein [Alphaproteobacteria bacterium]|nr:DUF4142 domain-containing protein [Alphaproteobacteria bacterium]
MQRQVITQAFLGLGFALAGLVCLPPPAEATPAAEAASAAPSVPSEAVFAREASLAGLFDVKSGELAVERAQQEDVRQLARDLVDDQKLANARLRAFAPKYVRDELSGTYETEFKRLQAAGKNDFDRLFLDVQSHRQSRNVKLFEGYAAHGGDAVLRGYASETLAAVKKHRSRVEALR